MRRGSDASMMPSAPSGSDLTMRPSGSITAELAGTAEGLAGLPGVHDLKTEGTRVRFDVDSKDLDQALGLLTRAGVRSLTSQPPTLEELFLRHYADDLAKENARHPVVTP